MSDKWECTVCQTELDDLDGLYLHYKHAHERLMHARGKRFRRMNPTQQYQSLVARRVGQIREIKQCKIDAEYWNNYVRKPGETRLDTKWCDELLQFVIEMIPRKPK